MKLNANDPGFDPTPEFKKSFDKKWTACLEMNLGRHDYKGEGEHTARLSITLYKAPDGTGHIMASVGFSRGGITKHAIGFGTPGGDFSKRYATNQPLSRVTKKALADMWRADVAPYIDSIESCARLHYSNAIKKEG